MVAEGMVEAAFFTSSLPLTTVVFERLLDATTVPLLSPMVVTLNYYYGAFYGC